MQVFSKGNPVFMLSVYINFSISAIGFLKDILCITRNSSVSCFQILQGVIAMCALFIQLTKREIRSLKYLQNENCWMCWCKSYGWDTIPSEPFVPGVSRTCFLECTARHIQPHGALLAGTPVVPELGRAVLLSPTLWPCQLGPAFNACVSELLLNHFRTHL